MYQIFIAFLLLIQTHAVVAVTVEDPEPANTNLLDPVPPDNIPVIDLLDSGALPEAVQLDRLEASRLYRDLSEAKEFKQALDAAQIAYDKTVDSFSETAPEVIPVLTDLGEALLNVGQPVEAIGRFEQSVQLIEQHEGIFSDTLVRPLSGIGLSQQALSNHPQAIRSFQRAQHVTHRTSGVVNIDQLPVVRSMSQSLIREGLRVEAERLLKLTQKIYRRNYGENSPLIVPGLMDLAQFYRNNSDFRRARIMTRDALKILESNYETQHPAYLPVLNELASSYLKQSAPFHYNEGLSVHQQIVDVYSSNPDLPVNDHIESYLRLGDWHIKFNNEKKAWEQYRKAWELAAQLHDPLVNYEETFERVHLIHSGPELPAEMFTSSRILSEFYYRFEFDVSANGRPKRVKVLETNLHAQTRAPAIRAIQFARFRPRIVDGAAVSTENHQIKRVYQPSLSGFQTQNRSFERPGFQSRGRLTTRGIR